MERNKRKRNFLSPLMFSHTRFCITRCSPSPLHLEGSQLPLTFAVLLIPPSLIDLSLLLTEQAWTNQPTTPSTASSNANQTPKSHFCVFYLFSKRRYLQISLVLGWITGLEPDNGGHTHIPSEEKRVYKCLSITTRSLQLADVFCWVKKWFLLLSFFSLSTCFSNYQWTGRD